MSFWGVLCIFATGNLQIINDSSKIWQVIVCMGLGSGCLAIMHTTVFPEIVEQAENSLIGRQVYCEKLNVYLCSLFVFLSSVSQMIRPFLANILAEEYGYSIAYVICGCICLSFVGAWALVFGTSNNLVGGKKDDSEDLELEADKPDTLEKTDSESEISNH